MQFNKYRALGFLLVKLRDVWIIPWLMIYRSTCKFFFLAAVLVGREQGRRIVVTPLLPLWGAHLSALGFLSPKYRDISRSHFPTPHKHTKINSWISGPRPGRSKINFGSYVYHFRQLSILFYFFKIKCILASVFLFLFCFVFAVKIISFTSFLGLLVGKGWWTAFWCSSFQPDGRSEWSGSLTI